MIVLFHVYKFRNLKKLHMRTHTHTHTQNVTYIKSFP